jgi:hypothetical protein
MCRFDLCCNQACSVQAGSGPKNSVAPRAKFQHTTFVKQQQHLPAMTMFCSLGVAVKI